MFDFGQVIERDMNKQRLDRIAKIKERIKRLESILEPCSEASCGDLASEKRFSKSAMQEKYSPIKGLRSNDRQKQRKRKKAII